MKWDDDDDGDRVDPLMRSIFGVGRKTRRKIIPAAGDGGDGGWPVAGIYGRGGREFMRQLTQDEGVSSERPSEALPTPSPAPTSEVPYEPQTDSSPAQTSEVPFEHQPKPSLRPSPSTTTPAFISETSSENLGGHSSSDKSLSGNEGDMTIQ
ncbi:hypothetical protein Tco_1399278, partial [Tanacetum coccineum]